MGCWVTEKGDEGKDKAVTLNSTGINPDARVCLVIGTRKSLEQ